MCWRNSDGRVPDKDSVLIIHDERGVVCATDKLNIRKLTIREKAEVCGDLFVKDMNVFCEIKALDRLTESTVPNTKLNVANAGALNLTDAVIGLYSTVRNDICGNAVLYRNFKSLEGDIDGLQARVGLSDNTTSLSAGPSANLTVAANAAYDAIGAGTLEPGAGANLKSAANFLFRNVVDISTNVMHLGSVVGNSALHLPGCPSVTDAINTVIDDLSDVSGAVGVLKGKVGTNNIAVSVGVSTLVDAVNSNYSKLGETNRVVATLQTDVADLETKNVVVVERLNSLDESVEGLSCDISTLQTDVADLETKNATEVQRLTGLVSTVERNSSTVIALLTGIAGLETKNAVVVERLNSLDESVDGNSSNIVTLQATVTEFSNHLQCIESTIGDSPIELPGCPTVTSAINSVIATLVDVSSSLVTVEEKVDDLAVYVNTDLHPRVCALEVSLQDICDIKEKVSCFGDDDIMKKRDQATLHMTEWESTLSKFKRLPATAHVCDGDFGVVGALKVKHLYVDACDASLTVTECGTAVEGPFSIKACNNDTLSVTCDGTSVKGGLNVIGKVTAENDVEVKGKLVAKAGAEVTGLLDAKGAATVTGKLTANGGAEVKGPFTVNDDGGIAEVNVNSDAIDLKVGEYVGMNMGAEAGTVVNGGLTVSSDGTWLYGGLDVKSGLTNIDGGAVVRTSFEVVTDAESSTAPAFAVSAETGNTTIDGDTTMTGALRVTNGTTEFRVNTNDVTVSNTLKIGNFEFKANGNTLTITCAGTGKTFVLDATATTAGAPMVARIGTKTVTTA